MNTRRTIFALVAMVALATTARAADENWAAQLSGAIAASDDAAPADTGVVGMTAEELPAYAASPNAADEGDDEVPDDFVRNRRRFVLREMKFNADWDTDPTSLPALIDQYKRRTGVDAQALQP